MALVQCVLQSIVLIYEFMAVDQLLRSVSEDMLQVGDNAEITIKLLEEGCYLEF